MKHFASLAIAVVALLSACYVAPESTGFPGDKIAKLEVVDPQPIPADGQFPIHVILHIDPNTATDTVITVETSTGTLSVSADPTTAEARKIIPKSLGTGLIDLKLRVSNAPGPAIITATVGGYITQTEIKLSASLPEKVVLSSTKKSLPADGESKFDITAQLLAKSVDGAANKVSLGVRVRFAVCCADASNDPVPCSSADPLTIPVEAQLDSGQAIAVQAITDRILVATGGPESIPAWIVARAVLDENSAVGALCEPPFAGEGRATLALAVRPIKP